MVKIGNVKFRRGCEDLMDQTAELCPVALEWMVDGDEIQKETVQNCTLQCSIRENGNCYFLKFWNYEKTTIMDGIFLKGV